MYMCMHTRMQGVCVEWWAHAHVPMSMCMHMHVQGVHDEWRAQLAGVEKLLESLGSANADPAAREEVNNILVEAFVKPAFRSFQKTGSRGDVGGDYPALGGPTGYSGDKRDGGDGQNTAVSRVLPCASGRPNMLPLTPPLQWKI